MHRAGLDLDADGLSTVRTRTLVRFLQADVSAKSEAMVAAVTKALRKRKVDIALAESLLLTSTDEGERSTRLSLLAQLLLDWQSHHNRRQSRTDEGLLRSLVECVKEAVRDALPVGLLQDSDGGEQPPLSTDAPSLAASAEGVSGSGLQEGGDVEGEEDEGMALVGASTDLIALAQVLEVLSAYEYKDTELSCLVGLYVEAALEHGGELEQSSEDCRRLYDLGRLKGSSSTICTSSETRPIRAYPQSSVLPLAWRAPSSRI